MTAEWVSRTAAHAVKSWPASIADLGQWTCAYLILADSKTRRKGRFEQAVPLTLPKYAPPVWPQFIFVPRIRKPPGLFGAQDSTVLHVTGSTPSIEMLLRPEEKHGASRKSDVVPPLVSGHRKMNDSFPTGDVAVSNFQLHRIATVSARRIDYSVLVKGRSDAQRVPDAYSPIVFASSLNSETGRNRTKRICGPNTAVIRSEDEDFV